MQDNRVGVTGKVIRETHSDRGAELAIAARFSPGRGSGRSKPAELSSEADDRLVFSCTLKGVKGVNSVVYDVTSKRLGTIEWE